MRNIPVIDPMEFQADAAIEKLDELERAATERDRRRRRSEADRTALLADGPSITVITTAETGRKTVVEPIGAFLSDLPRTSIKVAGVEKSEIRGIPPGSPNSWRVKKAQELDAAASPPRSNSPLQTYQPIYRLQKRYFSEGDTS